MLAETHMWRTDDGRLVPHGHPDAAVLAYPKGQNIPQSVAERHGLKAKGKPEDKAKDRPEDKVQDGPNNPRRIWPSRTSRSTGDDSGQGDDERREQALERAKALGLRGLGNAKTETIERRIAEAEASAEG